MLWRKGTDPYEGGWPGLRVGEVEFVDGMQIRRDVPVVVRDGVTIYVDVFTPQGHDEPLPVLLTWSPYGKHAPKTFDIFPNSGVPRGSVSRYAVWEGPDPVHWTRRGFAVVNGDTRGSWGSQGDLEILGPQEAQDGYDLVEWIAAQEWSNRRVGMVGVSYLAMSQYRVAALRPPHLACINPWEGLSDVYREYAYHGGIPETNFHEFMQWSCRCSLGQVEDWVGMHRRHRMLDDYYRSKRAADLADIEVPTYLVADWGDQGLHTRGTLQVFREISSPDKWLEVHGRKKWQYYYQESSLRRQEAFYRRFLLDQPTEVDRWPRVRIEVRDRAFTGQVRDETDWPLPRTEHHRRYLDAATATLSDTPVERVSHLSYDSETVDDHVTFTHRFDRDTELTGGMRLRLWVSAPQAQDMDLFVQLDKLDTDANVTPFVAMSMLDDGPLALGWLRVSHRELDPARSREDQPWLTHQRRLPLREGETVPVDIEIWPSSTHFHTGEALQITIQGNDIFRYDLPQAQLHQDSVNTGPHVIWSGGPYDSYLVIPVIPARADPTAATTRGP